MRTTIQATANDLKSKEVSSLMKNKYIFQDDSGYSMFLEEVTFRQIELCWGSYTNPTQRILTIQSDKPAIVSHFQLSDSVVEARRESLREKQFMVYQQMAGSYDLSIAPTQKHPRTFFELSISDRFFNNLVTEESDFLMNFHQRSNHVADMLPEMYEIIYSMEHAPYTGDLKGIYLESKAVQLFLAQVSQLDRLNKRESKLKRYDIDCLYAVKEYLDLNYFADLSIVDLAREAGINQTKLKAGFKELFNHTVFGYLRDLRMLEAKRLLQDEGLNVNEVSERIGYSYPQHFSSAFKRKFGVLPKAIKI